MMPHIALLFLPLALISRAGIFVSGYEAAVSSETRKVLTTTGKECRFPFRQGGRLHHRCITVLSPRPWCSLTRNFDRDRQWGFCTPDRTHPNGSAADPCQVNPCQNGGVCAAVARGHAFGCSCPEGFSGRRCEQKRCFESLHLRYYDTGESWGRVHMRNVERCTCAAGAGACERVHYTSKTAALVVHWFHLSLLRPVIKMIHLCTTLMLSIASVISGKTIDTSRFRVFPAMNQSIGGVFQVSQLDQHHQPKYAFNASDARTVCSSLRVSVASKAEVEKALASGLETCRFGWVDENLAVIPRIHPLSNCGKQQVGVVIWRAPVTQRFDVFCFNESDVVTQLTYSSSVIPPSSREPSGQTQSASNAPVSAQTSNSMSSSSLHPSSSSPPKTIDREAPPAQFVGTAQGSGGAKIILITSTCALSVAAVIIFVYLKLQRSHFCGADEKQQQEYIETRELECVKSIEETEEEHKEEDKIAIEDDAS